MYPFSEQFYSLRLSLVCYPTGYPLIREINAKDLPYGFQEISAYISYMYLFFILNVLVVFSLGQSTCPPGLNSFFLSAQ
jgi:hypothetical protein